MKASVVLAGLLVALPLANTWAQEKIYIDVQNTGSGNTISVDRPRVELRQGNPKVQFHVAAKHWFFDASAGGITFKNGNCDASGCEFTAEDTLTPDKKVLNFNNRFSTFDKEFHYSIYLVNKNTGEQIELDPVLINKR